MKLILDAQLIKRSLAGHSWLGVMLGALMYLLCLSGTLLVFENEWVRWEQPGVAESQTFNPASLEPAYRQFIQGDGGAAHYIYLALPGTGVPRVFLSSGEHGRFINPDGSLGAPVTHRWIDMLVDLHVYLHLPETLGLMLVGTIGALLCGLILSGLLAHPRIFRDAFALRLRGSRRLAQADTHNRLSVWTLPFQLCIAITGAYFGLARPLSLVLASVFFGGNTHALTTRMFGPDPVLTQPATPVPALQSVLQQVHALAPQATPMYITVEHVGTPQQSLLVGARYPGRLIYAEQYRFDSNGRYLGKAGYSDGATGRQAIYSTYRLHFGSFGSWPVKGLYVLLGLAMTVVSVTGINVWLARRQRQGRLQLVWIGLVWGTPAALALAAIAQVLMGLPAKPVLWIAIAAAIILACLCDEPRTAARRLQLIGAAAIGALAIGHVARFASASFSPAAAGIDIALSLTALLFLLPAAVRRAGATPYPTL